MPPPADRDFRAASCKPPAGGRERVLPRTIGLAMTPSLPQISWLGAGKSVRGAAHLRSGLPNQDAIGWQPEFGPSPRIVLAVSDGHGSAKCLRSDVGARLAIEAAIHVMRQFLESKADSVTLSLVKRTAEERLPQELVKDWLDRVKQHHQGMPFDSVELEALASKEGAVVRQSVEDNPVLAYGATLLVAYVAESFAIYLQQGDGDIVIVSDAGEVTRPLPQDDRLFANETTSLCGPNAWRDFRVRFQILTEAKPALLLLSTDGYANSFRDDKSFLQVGADVLELIRAEGLNALDDKLETWLADASRQGSGDDITLGIVCRADLAETVPPASAAGTSGAAEVSAAGAAAPAGPPTENCQANPSAVVVRA